MRYRSGQDWDDYKSKRYGMKPIPEGVWDPKTHTYIRDTAQIIAYACPKCKDTLRIEKADNGIHCPVCGYTGEPEVHEHKEEAQ